MIYFNLTFFLVTMNFLFVLVPWIKMLDDNFVRPDPIIIIWTIVSASAFFVMLTIHMIREGKDNETIN